MRIKEKKQVLNLQLQPKLKRVKDLKKRAIARKALKVIKAARLQKVERARKVMRNIKVSFCYYC